MNSHRHALVIDDKTVKFRHFFGLFLNKIGSGYGFKISETLVFKKNKN